VFGIGQADARGQVFGPAPEKGRVGIALGARLRHRSIATMDCRYEFSLAVTGSGPAAWLPSPSNGFPSRCIPALEGHHQPLFFARAQDHLRP